MVLFKESLAQWAPERKDGKQNAQGDNYHVPQFCTPTR